MVTRLLLMCTLVAFSTTCQAQKAMSLVQVGQGTNASIRGMSIPSNECIWVSGSNGTVGRSIDGGITWQWMIVKDYEKLDFRDIEAFDSSIAVIMAIDNPAYIFKTIDGGRTWKKTFEKKQDGMFLDAIDFKNEREGICIGDPLLFGEVGRKFFYVIKTMDGGDTWNPVPIQELPPAQPGEAIFSASGSNISFLDHPEFEYAFVTGGAISNFFMIGRQGKPSKSLILPMNQGLESTGTFSMATDRLNKFYCIGGDYKAPQNQYDNFCYTANAGKKWSSPSVAPTGGYRSCIRMIDEKRLIACGTNGIDYSKDGGKAWLDISKEGFNVCMETKDKKYVFFAGDKGKIARLNF
jgi:photosystem II stability/assembly factor-like uncharacterized protein